MTVLVPEQDDPAGDGVAETYVVPAGRMSVTVTAAAEAGPAFRNSEGISDVPARNNGCRPGLDDRDISRGRWLGPR